VGARSPRPPGATLLRTVPEGEGLAIRPICRISDPIRLSRARFRCDWEIARVRGRSRARKGVVEMNGRVVPSPSGRGQGEGERREAEMSGRERAWSLFAEAILDLVRSRLPRPQRPRGARFPRLAPGRARLLRGYSVGPLPAYPLRRYSPAGPEPKPCTPPRQMAGTLLLGTRTSSVWVAVCGWSPVHGAVTPVPRPGPQQTVPRQPAGFRVLNGAAAGKPRKTAVSGCRPRRETRFNGAAAPWAAEEGAFESQAVSRGCVTGHLGHLIAASVQNMVS